MKKIIIRIILSGFIILNAYPLMSQGMRMYRPLKFELSGVKNGISVINSTRNFEINIYEDGQCSFKVNLNDINIFIDSLNNSMEFHDDLLILKGLFPLVEIRDNQQSNQNYKFDLEIENDGVSQSKLFDINVVYNKVNQIYNVTMVTKLDLRQYKDLYKYGLEPEVDMIISFETKWN
jgi:hypothetical protein